jgi:hypothetical protein
MTPDITLTKALTSPELFGATFAAPSFWTWRVIGKLIDGIPLTEPSRDRAIQTMHRTHDIADQAGALDHLAGGTTRGEG